MIPAFLYLCFSGLLILLVICVYWASLSYILIVITNYKSSIMNLRNLSIATLTGFATFFVIGMISYVLYYQSMFESLQIDFPSVMNAEPNFAVGMFMGIAQAFLLVMYFLKAKITTVKDGAINGFWISAVIWLVANGNMLTMTKLTSMNYFLIDIIISGVMGAICGAVLVMVINRLKK